MNERVLTLARMARLLGVTTKWLRGEAESNRVPHLKADNRLLFNPDAVEQVLAERAATPSNPEEAAAR